MARAQVPGSKPWKTREEIEFMRESGLLLPWEGQLGKVNRYDFPAVVAHFVRHHGGTMEEVLVDIFQSLMLASRLGDTQASKILLDRFCGPTTEKVDLTVSQEPMTATERQERVEALLAKAARRIASEDPEHERQPLPRPRITLTVGEHPANGKA